MNNFGVIELASTKTTNAPGWAYVPDRQHHPAPSTAAPSTNRKRARAAASGGAAALSTADANARLEAKTRRELEILDRDNARDVHIAIPPKTGGGGGRPAAGKKHTPNVRRILQSQKTFANHLDDYVALQTQQQETNPAGSAPAEPRRAGQRQTPASASAVSKKAGAKHDVLMSDRSQPEQQQPRSTLLTPYPAPPSLPGDDDPLLVSRLPPPVSDEELRALLAAPPLSYLEARGTWPAAGREEERPTRAFCAVCGYWGRVRCMKCGTRVCALECLETHQEECVTRYGL